MKQIICFLVMLVALFGCASPPPVSITINASIEIPEDPSKPEAGTFIPVDTPLKLNLVLTPAGQVPEKIWITMRIIDHNETELQKNRWVMPELADGINQFLRLYRVNPLPGSRKIKLQIGLSDDTGQQLMPASGDGSPWQTVFAGYALHNSVRFSRGWHPVDMDSEADGTVNHWSKGNSTIHFAQPLFPALFQLEGFSQPQYFPEKKWIFTGELNGVDLFQETLSGERFTHLIPVPAMSDLSPVTAAVGWPAGEMELTLNGDQTFVPLECSGQPDKRRLAFNVETARLTECLPVSGFYTTERQDGIYWPSPDFTVILPVPQGQKTLYIQGIRPADCIEMPQTVTVTVAGQTLPAKQVSDEWFCLSWPMPVLPDTNPTSLPVRVTVSPVFFRAQCMDTDDNRPYSLGLEAISIRD